MVWGIFSVGGLSTVKLEHLRESAGIHGHLQRKVISGKRSSAVRGYQVISIETSVVKHYQ